ncbi:RRQRL motif-containing zinc-binding protein [Streptomyces sp. NPDC056921]|uniref:RRQRL motif-containing zinc-binding protein n=1 Tax=Streptomyces sp. NPDC056921 TaxID=3345966 RepID=UPI00364396D5
MAGQDQDLVDADPNERGDGFLPVFRWKQAGRENLATRRELREMGLRPGGQEPAARIECRGGKRFAWLYRIDLAKPKVPMTLAKEAALDKAMAAR